VLRFRDRGDVLDELRLADAGNAGRVGKSRLALRRRPDDGAQERRPPDENPAGV